MINRKHPTLDRKYVLIGCFAITLIFGLGISIGYFSRGSKKEHNDNSEDDTIQDQFANEAELIKEILENVSTDNLRSYLQELSKEPHIAGQERDNKLTEWIQKEWKEMGLDHVELATYDLYLSWPNASNPNKIYILDEKNTSIFTSKHKEVPLIDGDSGPNFIDAFNAYTPPGIIEGDLVYVHYARVEDIRKVKEIGMDLKGKICMARYGRIFRGNKLQNCQDAGAIGMIIFSDPGDVAVQGIEAENVYPNTIFLPGSGIQRGSYFLADGDPLSPDWPSVPNAYRLNPEDLTSLPKIPSQPIGYDDAKVILEYMDGPPVPEEWQGAINITYKLGGSTKNGYKFKLSSHNHFSDVKSSNVIGYIKGKVEPDRYVMFTNHRDAWGYGAIDPSSGTCQLMEAARTFGEMLKKGWRPRRTIVLVSLAAEEYGLGGSTEWVYQHVTKLMHRTVGLVNVDLCVGGGPIAIPEASAVLKDMFINALKMADNPTPDGPEKYYDFWDEWTNSDNNGTHLEPEIALVGAGSDHAPFAFYANIPVAYLEFGVDDKKFPGLDYYPMYHTGYETFYYVDKLVDPGFKIHKTCTQASLHMLLELADSAVLPYNLERFPKIMQETLEEFDANNVTSLLQKGGVTLEYIKEAVNEFKNSTEEFMKNLQETKNSLDSLSLRIVNDQMMQLERVFNMPTGLPGRPSSRNAIFAPSKFNSYGGAAFPGIIDLLHEIDDLDNDSKKKRYEELKKHVSDLMIMIKEGSRFLFSTEII